MKKASFVDQSSSRSNHFDVYHLDRYITPIHVFYTGTDTCAYVHVLYIQYIVHVYVQYGGEYSAQ